LRSSSSYLAAAQKARPWYNVAPASSVIDEPVHVLVRGLKPGEAATLSLSGEDALGRRWRSSAVYRANRQGAIDVDRARPTSGSYRGAWGMGLVASLTTRASSSGKAFAWSTTRPGRFRVQVFVQGRTVASYRFVRRLPKVGARSRALTVSRSGLYGRYYAPPPGRARGPGVLVFGGSEGGLSFRLLPAMLAWHGHPTLSLAYFKEPGLPKTLSKIPLEYFAGALRWLRAQPEVGRHPVAVIGVSRGSEAAQLLGVHYPSLVGAVVAAVPSNAVLCDPSCTGAAWTLHGRSVPYTREFNDPRPSDTPAAVIPVERVRGPMLLVCGGRDLVWRSCPYAHAISVRRRWAGRSSSDASYIYPRAGHDIGLLLPYQAVAPRSLYFKPADERAREDLWPRVLSFLERARP
jgi:dienelactone hydrolase